MKSLEELEREIGELDEKIKDLFLKRLELAKEIIQYKEEGNSKEDDIEARSRIKKDENVLVRKFYIQVDEALRKATKQYQIDIKNYPEVFDKTTRIAYFGIGHSNTYISLVKMLENDGYKKVNDFTLFKDDEEIQLIPSPTMEDLKNKMIRHEVEQGFIPYVNSNAGVVMASYNLMREIDFKFVKRFTDQIILYLYVRKDRLKDIDINNLNNIETIYSNLPALNQCSDYINQYLPFATFKSATSTTSSIEKVVKDDTHLAACLANSDAVNDDRVARISDNTVSNEGGTRTKFLLIEYEENNELLIEKDNLDDYFVGHYYYISNPNKGHLYSVQAKSYRVVEIKKDLDGHLKMFIYAFGNDTVLISHSKNVTTYIDARTKEACLMYEYETDLKKNNVNGVAFIRTSIEELRKRNSHIRGEFIGRENGKIGYLEYHRISEEEYRLLIEEEK